MGKAGVWSCCNVGASSPLERGSFYAWGETEFTYIDDSPQNEERILFFPVAGSIYGKTNWLDYSPLYYETGYYEDYTSLYWLSDIRTETDNGDHYSSPIPAAIWDEDSPLTWEERYYGCAVRPIMK